MTKPYIAASSYLNAAPLCYSFIQGEQKERCVFLSDAAPVRCSELLANGSADAALIPLANTRLRSDVSCTVFISEPGSYQGGELSIVIGNQAIAFKGAPGEAILYPSTTLHEVVPVRSGERLVAITFIESFIPDPHQRMQVYELNEIAALEGTTMRWENRVRLDVVRQNLMRMWTTT